MSGAVLQICVMSMVCGAIMSLMPEGGCKNVSRILCTVILIMCVLDPIMQFDFESYALQSAMLHEREASFSKDAKNSSDSLNKAFIEQNYSEYILDKARELNLNELQVQLSSRWDEQGIWVPFSVELKGTWSTQQKLKLKSIIKDELGIPEERQQWKLG